MSNETTGGRADNSPNELEHPRAYRFGRLAAKFAVQILVPVLSVFVMVRLMGFRDAVIVLLVLLLWEVWFYGE